jgi:acetate kinase
MSDIILVLNCGSSSIKYQLFRMPEGEVLAKGLMERIGEESGRYHHTDRGGMRAETIHVEDHRDGLNIVMKCFTTGEKPALSSISEIKAVGHRVVHGGEAFTGSVLITDKVKKTVRDYCDLAPLHNPPNLAGIEAAEALMPGVPQVAYFDTAFHSTMPRKAYLYALPYEVYEKYRVRRYGFHGTSHHYVAQQAAAMLGIHKNALNAVTCHLGNGCSMAAVRKGKSVDTTMGLTPLEGLVMGTRSGDIDPAIIFYLAGKPEFKDIEDINKLLNKKSGLLGLSGLSNDLRTLLDAARGGNERAKLAIEVFAYRIRKYIGAFAAILPKLDAIVFTGGIGENAASVRAQILKGLDENLGVKLDAKKNARAVGRFESGDGVPGADVATPDSRVRILVIPTNEEKAIALSTDKTLREQRKRR